MINDLNDGEGQDELVAFRYELQDTSGNVIADNRVKVGDEFLVQIYVKDLRAEPVGLFSAYLDIQYSDNVFDRGSPSYSGEELFSLGGTNPNDFGTDANAFDDFWTPAEPWIPLTGPAPIYAHPWTQNYDTGTPPLPNDPNLPYYDPGAMYEFDEVGVSPQLKTVPSPETPIVNVRLRAEQVGIVTFAGNPADLSVSDTLLLGLDIEIPLDMIDYGTPLSVEFFQPVDAVDLDANVDEDGSVSIDVLASVQANEGSTLPISIDPNGFTGPLHGSVSIVSNEVVYTPDADYFGTDSFTYTVRDNTPQPDTNTDSATVSITINPINDPPIATANAFNVVEGSIDNMLDVIFDDSVGPANEIPIDSISLDSLGTPDSGGTVAIVGDQIEYTPLADFFGTETFTYTIIDSGGLTDTATVTVNVANVNDPPIATDNDFNVAEDSVDNLFDVLFDDSVGPDNEIPVDSISLDSLGTPDSGGTATIVGGQIQYSPAADFFGTETFTYTIVDSGGLTDTATVTVNVASINDPPIATDDNLPADERLDDQDPPTQLFVLDNDKAGPDNETPPDTITIVAVSVPDAGGTVTIAAGGGSLIYTPEAGKEGFFDETFTYTIEDSAGLQDTATVTVTVEPVVRPRARDDFDSVAEDGQVTILVQSNDVFNDGFTASLFEIVAGQGPSNGTATIVGDTVVYEPNGDFFGQDSFQYRIDDDFAGSVPSVATVFVTVTPVNDAPIANPDDFTDVAQQLPEDQELTLDVLANDLPGPANETEAIFLNEVVSGPAHGSVVKSADNKFFLYTPAADYFGPDSFTYNIVDSVGDLVSNTATVTLEIFNVNDKPDAVDNQYTVDEDTTNNLLSVLGNDTVGPANEIPVDSISIQSAGTPDQGGTVAIVGDDIEYTPASDFFGTETFTYTIIDSGGLTDTATVTVNVANVNDPPIATDNPFNVDEDSVDNLFDVLFDDSVGPGNEIPVDSISLDSLGTPDSGGTATIVGGQIQYSPAADFFGTETFTYTIVDSGGLTDTATVTVNVASINDPPIATDDNLPADERLDDQDPPTQLFVLDNDKAGPDNETPPDTITIVAVSVPDAGGTVTIAPGGGSLIYTPETGKEGFFDETFTYTIEDSAGLQDTATVTVTVEPVVRPRARDDFDSVAEDGQVTILVQSNDVFNDGFTASLFEIVAGQGPSNGTATIVGDTIVYEPADDFFGSDSFQYVIDDDFVGDDLAESVPSVATVFVTVTPVNDAPIANPDDFTDVAQQIPEDAQLTLDVLSNDLPGPANETEAIFVNEVVSGPSHGTVVKSADELSFLYTPDDDYFGPDSFTYTIRDEFGAVSNAATVTLEVFNVNDAPIAVDNNYDVDEDSVNYPLNVLANDLVGPDNEIPVDSISLDSLGTPDQGGTVAIVGDQIEYSPLLNFVGTETFTYTIVDSGGLKDTATVRVVVNDVNDDPTVLNEDGSGPDQGRLLAIKNTVDLPFIDQELDVLANDSTFPDDPSVETLTIKELIGEGGVRGSSVTTLHGTATISTDGLKVIYTPATDFETVGSDYDTFGYVVQDGRGGEAEGLAEIEVTEGVPTDISGVIFLDTSGDGEQQPEELTLAGVEVTLTGTNIRGLPVNMTVKTDENGVFVFPGILPNALGDTDGYRITATTPDGLDDGDDSILPRSGDDDYDPGEAGNDEFTGIVLSVLGSTQATNRYAFGEQGVSSDHVSLSLYLASHHNGLLFVTDGNGDALWYSNMDGWEGIESIRFELLEPDPDAHDWQPALLTITAANGQTYQKRLAYAKDYISDPEGNGYMIIVKGTAEDFGFDLLGELSYSEPQAGEGEMSSEYARGVDEVFGGGEWA